MKRKQLLADLGRVVSVHTHFDCPSTPENHADAYKLAIICTCNWDGIKQIITIVQRYCSIAKMLVFNRQTHRFEVKGDKYRIGADTNSCDRRITFYY